MIKTFLIFIHYFPTQTKLCMWLTDETVNVTLIENSLKRETPAHPIISDHYGHVKVDQFCRFDMIDLLFSCKISNELPKYLISYRYKPRKCQKRLNSRKIFCFRLLKNIARHS